MRKILGGLTILILAGCSEGGPTMKPGEDCLGCHKPGGENTFNAAGTVFPSAQAAANLGVEGALVQIVDGSGNTVSLTSNSAGNFYTDKAITWPADITITQGSNTVQMTAAPSGACNGCHTLTSGRIHIP